MQKPSQTTMLNSQKWLRDHLTWGPSKGSFKTKLSMYTYILSSWVKFCNTPHKCALYQDHVHVATNWFDYGNQNYKYTLHVAFSMHWTTFTGYTATFVTCLCSFSYKWTNLSLLWPIKGSSLLQLLTVFTSSFWLEWLGAVTRLLGGGCVTSLLSFFLCVLGTYNFH